MVNILVKSQKRVEKFLVNVILFIEMDRPPFEGGSQNIRKYTFYFCSILSYQFPFSLKEKGGEGVPRGLVVGKT